MDSYCACFGLCGAEVMRAIEARKNEKMKKREAELVERQRIRSEEQNRLQLFDDGGEQDSESTDQVDAMNPVSLRFSFTQIETCSATNPANLLQVAKQERDAKKSSRSRQWRPSLESIEETES